MATPPRKLHDQVVHVIRKRVTYSDAGLSAGTVEVGAIPAGSFVLPATVSIETAFNAATTNVLTVGTSADDDGFVVNAGAAAGTAGVKTALTGALTGNVTSDTTVLVKYTQSGTAATAGVADIIVPFYPHAT